MAGGNDLSTAPMVLTNSKFDQLGLYLFFADGIKSFTRRHSDLAGLETRNFKKKR